MAAGRLITDRKTIGDVLESCRTVAVAGLSPKAERDSHRVGR